jgi:hypothetical protein
VAGKAVPNAMRKRARILTLFVGSGAIIAFGLSDERATDNTPITPVCPFLSPRQTPVL